MKKKLIREKVKLNIKIISVLFIFSIIVSAIYIVIIYNSEKELLYNTAQKSYNNFMWNSSDYINKDFTLIIYWLNSKRQPNTEIRITDKNNNIIEETVNSVAVRFVNSKKQTSFGYINFEDFRNSMTDEQYKKITNYLNSTSAENNKFYYQLLCTEYYETEKNIIPKTVEIVLTEKANKWYVQDEVVEKFELNTKPCENLHVNKIGEMHRNVIETDFIFNKYKENNIIGELKQKSDFESEKNSANDLFETENFNYIFYKNFSMYYQVENNSYEYVKIEYAEKFNVLLSCLDRIIIVFAYILILLFVVAIIIGIMSWKTVKKQIEQEEKLRNLTNSMAHDLKTPLFIISGNAESLMEITTNNDEKYYADVIVKQTNSINNLIHRMLNLSSLDSINYKLYIEKFSFSKLITDVLHDFGKLGKCISVDFEYSKNVEISADKKLIKSVIENLLDNAIKYSDDNEAVKIELTENSFAISNNCKSIDKSELKQIWEPYQRIKNNSTIEGNGLGLAIVKSIFELHKFKYNVKLKNNRITFSFTF